MAPIALHQDKHANGVSLFSCSTSSIADHDSQRTTCKWTAPAKKLHSDEKHEPFLDGYNHGIARIRKTEYPALEGHVYLDNAGTQIPAKSLIDAFARDISTHLYGNSHTHSLPARNSAAKIEAVRRQTLEFFHADPEHYDLVFVANASAAIKLVGECLRDYVDAQDEEPRGEQGSSSRSTQLQVAYHKDAHTSLVGLRAFASSDNVRVFGEDAEIDAWLNSRSLDPDNDSDVTTLLAYPGQSNMTGHRLPLHWLKAAKQQRSTYTLLDAAALATTKQLELDEWAPDFTAVSFYKIFGFPDLGALIMKKSVAHLLVKKRYFAGGTVDGVMIFGPELKMMRRDSIHGQLEEGTLPFHNIIALGHAFDTHTRLFESMDHIATHVAALTRYCTAKLQSLVHPSTGQKLCTIYSLSTLLSNDPTQHGGTISFNLRSANGSPFPYRSVECAANAAGIYVRSGAMCNPGGMATYLNWTPEELGELFQAGSSCSKPVEVWKGKWTGVVRVSFGAVSTRADVDKLIDFLLVTYVESRD